MPLRIAGKRRLKTLAGLNTRPTSARVRQVVFDILGEQVAGSSWLDVCSGSGAMGAEALCRGASHVVGIELSRAACQVVEANWNKIKEPEQQTRIIRGDARAVLSRPGSKLGLFNFIFFDPPYKSGLYSTLMPHFPRFLLPEGILIVEHFRAASMPQQIETLSLIDQRYYGQTGLAFYLNNG